MQRIIFTNSKGESITLGNQRPYILQFLNGTGGSETDVQMQKAPFQDGQTHIDTLLEARELSFEIAIMAGTNEEVYQRRADLVRVFNPKLGQGKLRYEYVGGIKEIDCVVDLAPVFPTGKGNKGAGWQRAMFTVICPSPFWEDIFETTEEFISIDGGFSFPASFPSMFSQITVSRSKVIENKGHVNTPIKLVMEGPLTSPIRFTNETTNEFIEVNQSLLEGEKLIVNTAFGNKRVEKVLSNAEVVNAFNYINLETVFWSLEPGNNLISYSTGLDGELSPLYIEFKNKYVGV